VASAEVSVVIPVHNGARYLPDAIASARGQSIAPIEIVVVDDGSTDDTVVTARALGSDIRLIPQPHSGVAAARNTGTRAARGSLVAFLDCDDRWTDDKLATQVPIMLEHPDIDVVLGHTRRMWLSAGELRLTDPELALHLGAALIRREIFGRVGAFDEALRRGEDWDWFMRAREQAAAMVVHPEVALLYRRHGGNMSNDAPASMGSLVTMIHRSIGRRRSGAGAAAPLPRLPSLEEYLRERAGGEGADPA